MPRGNGSYLGQTVNPNSNVASGIWTVREAETYLRADKWPAQPTVPSAPTGSAGNGQVALTWTAPTGGSTPTDYIVQYSSNGGSSWTTFSDGVSTATSAVVTGLTNGAGYIFRIIAVNALGQGPAGSASGTVTPSNLNVLLLVHFDGSNESTSFSDSSPNATALTVSGSPQISTASSKFGGASGYLVGDGYVSLTLAESIASTEDFTLEMWLLNQSTGNKSVFGKPDGATFYLQESVPSLYIDDNLMAGEALVEDAWNHIAFSRVSGVMTLYQNGVAQDSASIEMALSGDWRIGSDQFGQHYSGYVDELRLVKGTAVYTADFTPPTAPF